MHPQLWVVSLLRFLFLGSDATSSADFFGGVLKHFRSRICLLLSAMLLPCVSGQESGEISLPTSKVLRTPSAGRIGSVNSFPAAIAISPDSRYAALLNDGYGTQKAQAYQSITILDLATNQLTDFPDSRLGENAQQSYFLGLAYSSDGRHLYASVGSVTDPGGAKPGNTGNGIAVYKFESGKLSPEHFIKIAPQKIAAGKKIAFGVRKTAAGTAIPFPAGLAVVSGQGSDRLLVANNLSDNVLLIDSTDGHTLKQFDVSTHQVIPSSFPYTVVVTRD